MTDTHIVNVINGREVPSLIVTTDYAQIGTHKGAIVVERGHTTIHGKLQGSLHVEPDLKATVIGTVQGSVHVAARSTVVVYGAIEGSASVSEGATLIIVAGAKHAGSISNDGIYILRGAFGGSQSGSVPLILEGNGYIKQPIIKDGMNCYEW